LALTASGAGNTSFTASISPVAPAILVCTSSWSFPKKERLGKERERNRDRRREACREKGERKRERERKHEWSGNTHITLILITSSVI
jgi:hypothetical protein